MNKKLIKRIAVASLACFIIANFINIHSYSKTLVTPELCDKKLEEVKKAYENDEDVKKWTDYLDRVKKGEKISYTYTTAKTNEEKTITLTVKFCEEKLQNVKENSKGRYDGDVEYWTDLKNQVLTQDASTKTYIPDSEEEVEADKIKAATNQDLNSHIDIKSYEGNIVSYTKAIENAKKAIEKYKSQGYVEDSKMIQNKLKEIEKYEKDIELKKQAIQNEKNKQALVQAKKDEEERIANTIYQIPAGVDNVYDFVPHVDNLDKLHTYGDDEVHNYERADMPGIVFTLRCSWNMSTNRYSIIDVKPHYSFSNFKSIRIKRYDEYGSSRIVNCYIKQFTYNYLSPFNAFGSLSMEYMQASIGEDPRLATYVGGIAGIKKGENSFAAHLYWKETEEDGTKVFGERSELLENVKTVEEFQNFVNNTAVRQSQPLTNGKSDGLSGSIKKGQQLVEQWDAAGMDVIIEVTEY